MGLSSGRRPPSRSTAPVPVKATSNLRLDERGMCVYVSCTMRGECGLHPVIGKGALLGFNTLSCQYE